MAVVSHVKLFAQEQQDKAAIGVRVVKAHTDAVLEALSRAGTFRTAEDLAAAIAIAVLGAEDHTETRYCVITQAPGGGELRTNAYGPYLNLAAAEKAMAAGWTAWAPGSRAMVVPITPSPKPTKRPALKKKSTPKRKKVTA